MSAQTDLGAIAGRLDVNIAGTDVEALNAASADSEWFKEYLQSKIEGRERDNHAEST
jgi:hypothetical protein